MRHSTATYYTCDWCRREMSMCGEDNPRGDGTVSPEGDDLCGVCIAARRKALDDVKKLRSGGPR